MKRNMTHEEFVNQRQRKAFKKRVVSMTILAVIVLAAASLCFALFAPTFDIQNVVCEGNTHISSESLVSTAAVQTGNNIFLSTFGSVKERVESLDYVAKAEVKRRLPNTVCIIVTEEQPSAYFSIGSQLALTDLSGRVIDVVMNPDEAQQIVDSKITPQAPEPSETPEAEPEKDSNEDDLIWGYDDDGDLIYKINGGHYEFDEDGNRFFVDDSVPTATPEGMPEETPAVRSSNLGEANYDELPLTSGGTIIYSAPVVCGVNIKAFEQGKKIKSDDESKLDTVLSALNSLSSCGLLSRTTKIDAENPTDIKLYVEDRLEIWFGSFDDFDYKITFTASVINDNLSKYEHAIMDFRDSKLYVRSTDTTSPKMQTTPSPRPTAAADEEESDDSEEVPEDDVSDEDTSEEYAADEADEDSE